MKNYTLTNNGLNTHNFKTPTWRYLGILLAFLCTINLLHAQNPVPGKEQTKPILLKNATLHIGNGSQQTGSILFDKGKITNIGSSISAPSNAEIIDLTGKHVYPGLIAMGSQVGLSDIESIPATNDFTETGSLNPNVRTLVAYNTDSDIIPTVRSNGILINQAAPGDGFLAGQSSVFYMDGWNWQDAVLKADDGIWINWPPLTTRQFSTETMSVQVQKNDKRIEPINELSKLLADAKVYNGNVQTKNLKLDAVKGLFDGSKVLYIRANEAKEIIEAVLFAKNNGIKKYAVVGADHARECVDFLKENMVNIILLNTHETPLRNDDPVWDNYNLPSYLHSKGVPVTLSYAGMSWRTRNLPFIAGTAAAAGLDKEIALQMICLNAAKTLGIDAQVGSLEIGKHATLLVSTGDLLDMKEANVTLAYIQGRVVDLNNKHKLLNERFSKNIKNLK